MVASADREPRTGTASWPPVVGGAKSRQSQPALRPDGRQQEDRGRGLTCIVANSGNMGQARLSPDPRHRGRRQAARCHRHRPGEARGFFAQPARFWGWPACSREQHRTLRRVGAEDALDDPVLAGKAGRRDGDAPASDCRATASCWKRRMHCAIEAGKALRGGRAGGIEKRSRCGRLKPCHEVTKEHKGHEETCRSMLSGVLHGGLPVTEAPTVKACRRTPPGPAVGSQKMCTILDRPPAQRRKARGGTRVFARQRHRPAVRPLSTLTKDGTRRGVERCAVLRLLGSRSRLSRTHVRPPRCRRSPQQHRPSPQPNWHQAPRFP